MHAVRMADLFPGCAVLVLGCGPIGLCIAQVARTMGAHVVAVTDVYDAPLACATALGLGPCLNVRDIDIVDVAETLRASTHGDGYTVVLDTTGHLETQRLGLMLLQRAGTLVAMAGVVNGLTLDEASLAGERKLMTASNNFVEDFEIGLRLLTSGAVQVAPMITHTYPLEDAIGAFEVAMNKQGSGAMKVVLHPDR